MFHAEHVTVKVKNIATHVQYIHHYTLIMVYIVILMCVCPCIVAYA